MNTENLNINEQISALVDGQLSGEAVSQTVQTLVQDDQARANWLAYHVVGDVLRAEALSLGGAKDAEFLTRIRARLQDEAAPLRTERPMDSVLNLVDIEKSLGVYPREMDAANHPKLRWKWVVGFASLALVTVLCWRLMDAQTPSSNPAQLAQTPAMTPLTPLPAHTAAVPQESAPILVRDPRLDQLLQAHQQFGGASALQMPSGFVRNATFDRPAR
jgi:sigma-E factor negative regulatory protein RseA